jgi:phosphoglycerol transferase
MNVLPGNLRSRRMTFEIARVLSLLVLVGLIWCGTYHRWTARAWKSPIVYGGDGWWGMAAAKALADGEIAPIVQKFPVSFGAPFRANWNDYPSIEEGVLALWGCLVNWFGIFAGSNIVLLLAHLLAALSFYFVCRRLRYDAIFSAMGAVLFGCSRFAFARSLQHLGLTYYWHIPLGILVVWYCFEKRSQPVSRRRLWFCILVAILHGVQNIYYTGMFCQFLAAAILYQGFVRRQWQRTRLPLLLIGIVAALFVLMNVDTFSYQYVHGRNPGVLVRIYAGLELYALKPIELFLPLAHRIESFQRWAVEKYFTQSYSIGEPGSAYLGVIGIVALFWLAIASIRTFVRQAAAKAPFHFWAVLWILAFSVVGGINGIIGLFGFVFFRCTNRYSIFILAFVLLFLVRQLQSLTKRWPRVWSIVLAASITLIGCYDQTPVTSPADYHDVAVREDRYVASKLRAKLHWGGMIFQLPVADFPEVAAIGGMTDYEHFRPYLQSRGLRFSYGSVKGRTRERWQAEAVSTGMSGLVTTLEAYGFKAILINRAAYVDQGNALISELRSAGRDTILVDAPRLVGIALNPSPHPLLPPDFGSGWHDFEGNLKENRRWSSGDADITFENDRLGQRTIHLRFGFETLKPRHIRVLREGDTIFETDVKPGKVEPVQLNFVLAPGQTTLHFKSDVPADQPGNGDTRKLAFSMTNFELSAD